ncbi:hypothetical protein ACQUY5_27045 [Bacillus cereus]|uniref:hypothetical protein n=1 Tax=Bacillus cereus TaxID=1396 RepID=UPI003D17BBCB
MNILRSIGSIFKSSKSSIVEDRLEFELGEQKIYIVSDELSYKHLNWLVSTQKKEENASLFFVYRGVVYHKPNFSRKTIEERINSGEWKVEQEIEHDTSLSMSLVEDYLFPTLNQIEKRLISFEDFNNKCKHQLFYATLKNGEVEEGQQYLYVVKDYYLYCKLATTKQVLQNQKYCIEILEERNGIIAVEDGFLTYERTENSGKWIKLIPTDEHNLH